MQSVVLRMKPEFRPNLPSRMRSSRGSLQHDAVNSVSHSRRRVRAVLSFTRRKLSRNQRRGF